MAGMVVEEFRKALPVHSRPADNRPQIGHQHHRSGFSTLAVSAMKCAPANRIVRRAPVGHLGPKADYRHKVGNSWMSGVW